MKIILLGARGMLGQDVKKELGHDHSIVGRDLPDYDIRDLAAFIQDLEHHRPQAVINAAAYTAVDRAEDEYELALEINGEAPGRLAAACYDRGIRFVHISTDYVFDGNKSTPYLEADPTGPVNAYGRSKLIGEETAARACPQGCLIFRTSWLFGAGGKNFVRTLLEKFDQGVREFRVVSDQSGRPTDTVDLARMIGAGLEKGLAGIYHAANRGETTWCGFARDIFAAAGVLDRVRVQAIDSSQYPTRARRPGYSVLDTGRLERALGHALPDWREALSRRLDEMRRDPASVGY